MNITVIYKFQESYLPTKRHRIPRWRDVEQEIVVTIRDIALKEAPVAFIVTNNIDEPKEYRWFDDSLWVVMQRDAERSDNTASHPISEIAECIKPYLDRSGRLLSERTEEREVIDKIVKEANRFIIIDGVVYQKTGEPRYVRMTFGLGHNHGGTSLMIDHHYNSNISKDRYYNALDRERAISDTIATAKGRGDINSISRIGSNKIEVLVPEAVKCNPQKEHGNGCTFLNDLYEMTENTSDINESALLAVAFAQAEIGALSESAD